MKTLIYCLALFLCIPLSAQEKGVIPVNKKTSEINVTRAVVVGISDYQDPSIPDLRFADKDAAEFALWLQSAGGGNVNKDNIQLLLNEKATGAATAAAIDWLASETEEGDQAIIYFSGHGDVERNSLTQPGFLLCWDSGPNIYMGGGTYSLFYLREMVSVISVQKKAKVIVIADACRSGKLAGSSIKGAQLTTANLATQYENEVKILSCQANEYSLEGEQWGGGRGVFSYHLIEGLTGLADSNGNAEVTLMEIGRYLEDKVSLEVDPVSQVPITIGNRTEKMAQVDAGMLAALNGAKKDGMAIIGGIGSKGQPFFMLQDLDSSIVALYAAFEKVLVNKQYFEPENKNADYYFNQLISENTLAEQHAYITRQYAVALQEDAQQSINAILNADPEHILQSRMQFYETYKDFPKLLNRAAELLGEQHYLYKDLKAREYLFEGVVLYFKYRSAKEIDPEKGKEIMPFYDKSLSFSPDFPATHFFKGICFSKILKEPDSAIIYANNAVRYAETWTMPYIDIGFSLIKDLRKFEEGKSLLEAARKIDSLEIGYWKGMIGYYIYQGQINEAIQMAEKASEIAPDDSFVWMNLGILKQAQRKFDESEIALLKSIELNPDQSLTYYHLGKTYHRWGKLDETEATYLRAVELDPESELARSALATFYVGLKKYEEAEFHYLEVIKYNDPEANVWVYLSWVCSLNGHVEDAFIYLEKALEKGYSDQKLIEEDEGFAPVRELPGFRALMEKYF